MATQTVSQTTAAMTRHRFTVAEYQRMGEVGIFTEDDRKTKLPLYASAGIAEAWIVDLAAETLERHAEPRDGRYRLIASARPGESLASTVLPALAIPVADILK